MLHATTACTFSTSQLPKVVRRWCVLYLEMCFVPQLCALFSTSQLLKVVRTWCAVYGLGNVLRATTACTFSTSQLSKVVREWCFARFDLEMCFAPQRRPTFHLSSDHMAPTLRSLKSLQKHRISRLCYPFSHLHLLSSDSFSSMIFSLLLFSSLALPTSAFPSVHIVGSLTSKLPSPIYEINKI